MNIVHNREYLYTTVLFYCFGTVRPNADNSVYEIAILVLYIAIDLIVKRSDKLMGLSHYRGNSFLVQKKHSDYENLNACGRM